MIRGLVPWIFGEEPVGVSRDVKLPSGIVSIEGTTPAENTESPEVPVWASEAFLRLNCLSVFENRRVFMSGCTQLEG